MLFFVGLVGVVLFVFVQIDNTAGVLFTIGAAALFVCSVVKYRNSFRVVFIGAFVIFAWLSFFNIWLVERPVNVTRNFSVAEIEIERQIRIGGFICERRVVQTYHAVANDEDEEVVLVVYYGGIIPVAKIHSGIRRISG